MISELDEDTTGVPGPDGGFDLTLAERWGIRGGRLNGGYQLAAALHPLTTVMAAHGRPDPVVASATFQRPALAGPAHLATTVHRVGRRLASGSAQLVQPGPDGAPREVLRLEASFADLAASEPDPLGRRRGATAPPAARVRRPLRGGRDARRRARRRARRVPGARAAGLAAPRAVR